jgi:AraC-like DNA-binding protein
MKREYELVPHPQMAALFAFLVRIDYRVPHAHMEIEIGIVLEGTLHLTTNRGETLFRAGDMYYLNPMEFHELRSDGDTVLILALQISESMLTPYFPVIKNFLVQDLSIRPYFTGAEARYQDCLSLVLRFMLHYLERAPYYEFFCTALLNQLLPELYSRLPSTTLSESEISSNASRNDRINRIMDFIDRNFKNKLLLSEIAAREGVTMTHLSHFFRQTLNMSFQNFLAERRFSYAVTLLETTNLSMLDVSLASGFSDVRYLTQLCRKHYSCTPMAYRNSHRKYTVSTNRSVGNDQMFLSNDESIIVLQKHLASLSASNGNSLFL